MRLGTLIAIIFLLAYAVQLAASTLATPAPNPGAATGQRGVLTIEAPGLGPRDHLCATVWGWAPNGSILLLAKACGTGPTLTASFEGVERYLLEWRRSLLESHNDPRLVKPGIIVMLADTVPGQGIYSYIKTHLVDIEQMLHQNSLTIRLAPHEIAEMKKKPLVALPQELQSWPPRVLPGDTPGAYWLLTGNPEIAQNTPIPLSIVRLNGYLEHFRRDAAHLSELLYYTSSSGIVFSAAFGVASNSARTIIWSAKEIFAIGPTDPQHLMAKTLAFMVVAGYDENAKPLYTGSGLYPGGFGDTGVVRNAYINPMGPSKDVLIAVGFKGDVAYATYCLRAIGSGACLAYAYAALHRPLLYQNLMYYWYEVDNNPEDGKGVAEKVRSALRSGAWETGWTETHHGGYYKPYGAVHNNYHTTPLLGFGIPIAKLLEKAGAAIGSPVAPFLTVSVGTNDTQRDLVLVELVLDALRDPNVIYDVEGIHPRLKLYINGKEREVGAAYFDITVLKPGAAPPPPRNPGQPIPTSNDTEENGRP